MRSEGKGEHNRRTPLWRHAMALVFWAALGYNYPGQLCTAPILTGGVEAHLRIDFSGKGEVSKDGQRAARRSWIGDQAHRTIRSARSSETSHAAVRVAAAVSVRLA